MYDCVLSIRQAHETLIDLADVNLLKQQGLLPEHRRNKIRQLIESMAEEALTRMGIVILPFMTTQGSNKRLQGIHQYDIANDDFIKNFMHKMSFSNPSTGRRDVQRAFDFAVNEPKIGQYQDEARKVVERIENILNPPQSIVEDRGDVDTEILVPEQELKFSVLPKGTRLEEFARDIAEESGEADKTRVDLKRVAILNFIREIWGENQCYFARGKKTGRKMLDDETGLAIDEDYIVLCMQEFEDGEPTGIEHALAISPIHASMRHISCAMM